MSISFRWLGTAALVMGLGTSAATAQDRAVELRFAHWLPAAHSLAKTVFEPWAESVQKASNGSIKISFFPAQQLGKAPDHYDMARDGISDMSWINPGYQTGRFPTFEASELPFMVSSTEHGSAALDAWYRKYAQDEMKGVRLCMAHLHIGTFHSRAPISEPGQIKGMKIRSSNGTTAKMVSLLGGTNVRVSAPEARDALEKGVADAITFPWNSILTFSIDRVVKYHTDVQLYASTFAWVMNPSFYDGLSAAQKKVMDDHCNTGWAQQAGLGWGTVEDGGRTKLDGMDGHTLVKLSDAQLRAWRDAVAPLTQQWKDSASKAGINADQVLGELQAELKARNAAY